MPEFYRNQNRKLVQETIEALSSESSYELVYMPKHGRTMPSVKILGDLVDKLREVIFPGYFGNASLRPETYEYHIGVNTDAAYRMLADQIRKGMCFSCTQGKSQSCEECENKAPQMAAAFISRLPEIRRLLATDVQALYKGDPAAKNAGEIIFSYPAIRAMTNHRIAHELRLLEVPVIPRIIAEMAHSETGIDIHPGAQIGEGFAIDHGTGVVIGETSIIGKNVKLYQGVTLGAKSFPQEEDGTLVKGIPRHPIVDDDVVIYSNASVLGRITIGKGSVIGGNVWVTRDLAPNSRVLQRKATATMFENGAGI
ncbi:MAG TPA: serine O-acetyltransferase EpsC [Salinivirga sp.]|uniref:serine O-acetyltransferase EpsC n=1 Tax=Salinivirga sp. TaxID=1970192 RepID=UPI002B495DFD|nr:serine O-acetyltransferase EpsC [Salinivirga sp.]HKK59602.1 serine O-acetyltransferase EpsC [Salinivirga sp.]